MNRLRYRRLNFERNYWPGFVDALATVLLSIVFLLSVFILSHSLLAKEIMNKDSALSQLRTQIDELGEMLALERLSVKKHRTELSTLRSSLGKAVEEKKDLQEQLEDSSGLKQAGQQQADENKLRIESLNKHISALRQQISVLHVMLDDHKVREEKSKAIISDLGAKLNIALAKKVQKLRKYRSTFFGRLREILGERPDIHITGDRFVFQAEVLFQSGQDTLNQSSKKDLNKIAKAIIELEDLVPPDLKWALRIDGHTDVRPVYGIGRFSSNWELSVARALSVVQYFISKGVNPKHLIAAGFSEFHPVDLGTSEISLSKNRRIEIKLTSR